MKRKLLSMLLALMMVVGLLPMAALAADAPANNVAEVNGTKYTSVAKAIDATEAGQTVTLLTDVTEDVTIGSGKNIVLDLGGKTLTNANAGKATLSVAGTATVKNGTIQGGTSYYNIAVGTEAVPGGNLTLENITATAGNTGSSMIDNWGTLTIESGTYTGGLNVVKSEEGSKLTINGGTFTLDYAIKWKFNAAILVYGETLITDGTFINNAKVASAYPQVVMTGVVDGYTAITRITGGTFTNNFNGTNSGIFRALGKATSDNFEVSGGTFNKKVSSGYFAAGYGCVKENGSYVTKSAVTGVTLDKSELTLKVGETYRLNATTFPEDAENTTIEWATKDSKTVKVKNGLLTALKTGTVVITATPAGNPRNTVAECIVTVILADEPAVKDATPSTTVEGIENEETKTEIEGALTKTEVTGVADAVEANKDTLVESSGVDTSAAGITKVEVEVKVDVKVTSADLTGESKTLTFEAKPVATVKTLNGSKVVRQETVDVSNELLNGDEITVKLPLPASFDVAKLEQVKHIAEDGTEEYFLKTKKNGAEVFEIDETNNCVVLKITHFSTFELSGTVTYVEPVIVAAYQVTVNAAENGTVTSNRRTATRGQTVTLTVAPEAGCQLDTLTVTDRSGNAVELTDKGNGTYTFKMPASKVTVTATFKKAPVFTDAGENNWYTAAILWAAEKGVALDEDGSGLFRPMDNCTRADMVTFLWRVAGCPEPTVENPFTDVKESDPWYKAVLWAYETGVTKGYGSKDVFAPDAVSGRAQTVLFLQRAVKGVDATGDSFTDVPAGYYYEGAVYWALQNEVTKGYGDSGVFGPEYDCNRAEIITFIYRLYNK